MELRWKKNFNFNHYEYFLYLKKFLIFLKYILYLMIFLKKIFPLIQGIYNINTIQFFFF
jgi:hypothetical protein